MRPAATTLLALGLLSLVPALGGCLVPQSVEPNSSKQNVPPRLRADLLPPDELPRLRSTIPSSKVQACLCQTTLELQVQEDDPTVTLQARWFVDYDPNQPLSWDFKVGTYQPGSLLDQPEPYKISISSLRLSAGLHVVEVVVADQSGFDDTNLQLPYRALKPGYEAATYAFTVQIDSDAIQPPCLGARFSPVGCQ